MIYSVHTLSDSTYRSCKKKKKSCFISVFITLFQPLSITHYFNVVSTLKQQLSFFQPYFDVEGWSCTGWFSTVKH